MNKHLPVILQFIGISTIIIASFLDDNDPLGYIAGLNWMLAGVIVDEIRKSHGQ